MNFEGQMSAHGSNLPEKQIPQLYANHCGPLQGAGSVHAREVLGPSRWDQLVPWLWLPQS